jgi:enoyl-CoA hydratase
VSQPGPELVRSETAEGVGVLTLDRPDRLNALSSAVADDLRGALADLTDDPAVRAIVVAGAGRIFCAGADITELARLEDGAQFASFVGGLSTTLEMLARCPKPSVAALQGGAFGGGLELALACDLRVAEVGTRLGMPEINLGLLPGAAGTVRLPRLLPAGVATRMLLSGEPITAEEGQAFGLVADVVPEGKALTAATELAGRLAALPPLGLTAAKRLIREGTRLPVDDAILLERQVVTALFDTEDRVAGISAFLEKRSPRFAGR